VWLDEWISPQRPVSALHLMDQVIGVVGDVGIRLCQHLGQFRNSVGEVRKREEVREHLAKEEN